MESLGDTDVQIVLYIPLSLFHSGKEKRERERKGEKGEERERERERERENGRKKEERERPSVCAFNTPACVRSKRPVCTGNMPT